jgi:two-component system chemotaxis response regulator CheY
MAYNILIVDDSVTARSFIAKAITVSGVDIGAIHEARNGREALDILHAQWIDMVLADINMPVMSGIEMVRRMNADGLMKTVPVVIVSTERSETRIAELMAAGVREYLNKPFTPEKFKQVVERILGAAAAEAGPGAAKGG